MSDETERVKGGDAQLSFQLLCVYVHSRSGEPDRVEREEQHGRRMLMHACIPGEQAAGS